jgi:hypothetical protein
MGSIASLYDKIKNFTAQFFGGKGFSSSMTGYTTAELQASVFILVLASLFRIFSVPLGIVLVIAAIAGVIVFAPMIGTLERENDSDLNRVLFWVVIYFAIIIAVTMWGR